MKSVGIGLLLIVFSFAFGFLVIARLMPSQKLSEEHASNAPAANTPAPHDSNPGPNQNSGVPSGASSRSDKDDKPLNLKAGPSLEPEEGASERDSTERKERTATQEPVEPPKTNDTPSTDGQGDTGDENLQQPSNPDDETLKNRKKTSERRGTRTPKEDIQNGDDPRPPDANGETRPTKRERPTDDTPRTDSTEGAKTYRVQAGVFSTRERADAAKKELADKGIDATVRRIKKGDKVQFTVQAGVFRNRDGAETAKQQLRDAGVDSYIQEQ